MVEVGREGEDLRLPSPSRVTREEAGSSSETNLTTPPTLALIRTGSSDLNLIVRHILLFQMVQEA